MKIVFASGQTCNQFWIYSNFIADAIEKNEKFAIWIPDIAFEYFPNLLNSEFIYYPLYSKRLSSFFGYKNYVKVLNVIFSNKFAISFFNLFINILPNHSFLIVDVIAERSKFKYKNIKRLLSLYTPTKSVILKGNNFISEIKKDYEIIIGVHIRYGDYRTFLNGKYFYTLTQYANFFKNIKEIFKGKEIAFFITSNEKIDTTFFNGYNFFYLPNSIMAEDLFFLSKTDYILGPPSTFSAWASLYGETPLYFVENDKTDFVITDFIDIKDLWF
jgi:hypothetical protein